MANLKVVTRTRLRDEPKPTANVKRSLEEDDVLTATGGASGDGNDKWVEVVFSPENLADIKGWVLFRDCEPTGDLPPMEFAEDGFVLTAFFVARTLNNRPETAPWLVSPDFVIARALIDTGLKSAGAKIPGSDGVGPLQVTSVEWKAFTDSPAGAGFAAGQRVDPISQIRGAAYRMYSDAKAISALKAAPGGAKSDAFIPDYLDLLHSYLVGSPEGAVAILDAVQADKSKAVADVLAGKVAADRIGKLFEGRVGFEGVAQPAAIGDFVAATQKALDAALKTAFDKITQNAPDETLVVKQGEAPWYDVAQKEEAKNIAEPNPVILTYFDATDISPKPTSTSTAWCGAFAAFCMANSGSKAAKAAIPKSAALAVSWKSFGNALPVKSDDVPPGAVVVLSPGEGTGGTGHVGFFVSYSADGKFVQLLGGNQHNSVKKSNFPISQIAGIRWLDLGPENTADQVTAQPSNLSISKDAFDLIVEFEVSSEAAYRKRYHLPEWPGESSGVTIGIGYDVGQTPAAVFDADWKGRIPDAMFAALRATVGITGSRARPLAEQLKSSVDIPWETAIAVHAEKVIPRWVGVVKSALPHVDQLEPPSLGALVSLTFNRGNSYSKTDTTPEQRYREMHQIKDAMAAPDFKAIPQLIVAMKRLWPDSEGLRRRRDKEAEFFREGL